jgi:hypothetical protein
LDNFFFPAFGELWTLDKIIINLFVRPEKEKREKEKKRKSER